ncbi:hypothetical protein MHH52_18375 [Paenibacillus sp. FSL K6-0276]|uniref:hypothetical protein n=1 Tax=Paenibacillus sp. FSL K6-0276 TaxID=2921450 RepID=UPI0030EEC8A4
MPTGDITVNLTNLSTTTNTDEEVNEPLALGRIHYMLKVIQEALVLNKGMLLRIPQISSFMSLFFMPSQPVSL